MNQSTDNSKSSGSRKSWLAYLISAILITPIWAVIAIPATEDSFNETRIHGWPFVQLETYRIDELIYNLLELPPISQIDQGSCQRYAREVLEKRPAPKQLFDLRLGSKEYYPPHFWSDIKNWPFLPVTDGFACRWHWLGLLANLVILGIIIFCLGKFVGWRMRKRSRLFTLTLWELISVVSLCGIALGFLGREFDRASREQQLVGLELVAREWGRVGEGRILRAASNSSCFWDFSRFVILECLNYAAS